MELSNQVIYGKMIWTTLNFPKRLIVHLKQELEPINFAVNFVLVSIMHKILASLQWKLNCEVGRQKFANKQDANATFFTVPYFTAGTNLHGCVATVIDAVLKAPKLIVAFTFELSFVMVNVVVLPAKCFYQWLSFSFFFFLMAVFISKQLNTQGAKFTCIYFLAYSSFLKFKLSSQ